MLGLHLGGLLINTSAVVGGESHKQLGYSNAERSGPCISQKTFTGCISSLCVLAAIQQWRSEGQIATWLHIPIMQSHFIAPAASLGFCFHHTKPHSSTLTLWLGEGPSRLPGYATHQVGVAGQFRTHNHRNCLFTSLPCLLEAGLLVCQ